MGNNNSLQKYKYCEFCNLVDNNKKLIIYKNYIYNIESYYDSHTHPGGQETLEKAILQKKDIKEHINYHNPLTKKLMKKMKIAKLVYCDCKICL